MTTLPVRSHSSPVLVAVTAMVRRSETGNEAAAGVNRVRRHVSRIQVVKSPANSKFWLVYA